MKVPKLHDFNYHLMQAVVIDLETSIKNRGENAVGSFEAAPYHPDNKIVLYGCTRPESVGSLSDSFNSHFCSGNVNTLAKSMEECNMLVGHNIKFDLLYLLVHHYDITIEFFRQGGKIFDTMLAEYLLTNQMRHFAPLGNKYKKKPGGKEFERDSSGELITTEVGLGQQYGGTTKDPRIEEYWMAGIDTEDIPVVELGDYLADDLRNTGIVFIGQMQEIWGRGQSFANLLASQMDGLIATTFMEFYGMRFDIEKAASKARDLAKQHDAIYEDIRQRMFEEFQIFNIADVEPVLEDVNPGSTKQLNTFLFGGEFKFVGDVPQQDADGNFIKYKTGKKKGLIKTKKEEIVVEVDFGAWDDLPQLMDDVPKTSLGYKLDEETLAMLAQKTGYPTAEIFFKQVLKYRQLDKDLNTYYIGLLKLVWPTDGCIHGNINHVNTDTGRLSSSSPNQQNISGKK